MMNGVCLGRKSVKRVKLIIGEGCAYAISAVIKDTITQSINNTVKILKVCAKTKLYTGKFTEKLGDMKKIGKL